VGNRAGEGGVAGRLRHDFRRTAVRNMVSPADRQDVARKLTGIISGITDPSALDARAVTRENSSTRL